MSLIAAVGQAQALDGREAGSEATHQALSQVGRAQVIMAFVFVSHDFPIHPVINGVTALLSNTPILGFSTPAELTSSGQKTKSVTVALLAGSEINAHADWWPGFTDESSPGASAQVTQKMLQALQPGGTGGTLLFVADGLGGDPNKMVEKLGASLAGDENGVETNAEPGSRVGKTIAVAGWLSGADLRHGRSFQVGGQQTGSGGLAAAYISGNIGVGVGVSHGWQPVGAYFKVTRSRGPWVRSMDDRSPSELYAELFGHSAREWGFPPLNELVRLYPIGIEATEFREKTAYPYLVRSPMRMETDGSLRMNTLVPEGVTAHLMVGTMGTCMEAAEGATRQALDALSAYPGQGQPVLGLVLADVSWQMLFESRPGIEMQAVRKALGADIPLIGGYTLGQIASPSSNSSPELLNQSIMVILFKEIPE